MTPPPPPHTQADRSIRSATAKDRTLLLMDALPCEWFDDPACDSPIDSPSAAHQTTSGTVTRAASPRLHDYDLLVVNSSAGKDSQAALDVVARAAASVGVLHRVVVVHADVGEADWEGVPELAAEHTAHYGVRFELTSRDRDGAVETILDRVQQRGKWPDAARRWCTSDHNRGPIRKVMTRLVAELPESGRVVDRPVRILNILGYRAEESPARARRLPYAPNPASSNGPSPCR
jgi:3'-phosphoadenosine 5'-phosphosulfate sulfotransferase (PAPS reductase)/FAD synthetase